MQNQSKNNIELKIEKVVSGGFGIARREGEVYFIRGVLPEETVQPISVVRKRGINFVNNYRVVSESKFRVSPKCRYFGVCGGCDFQMADYKTQIEMKRSILVDSLNRIGGLNIDIDDIDLSIAESSPWNYRLRARLHFDGRNLGFNSYKSKEVVRIDECPVISKSLNFILKILSEELEKSEETPFIDGLKAVEIRTNQSEDSVSILFVGNSGNGSRALSKRIVERLMEFFEDISISLSLSKTELPGKGFKLLEGTEKIYTQYNQYSFGLSPLSFFQPNLNQSFKVYELIKNQIIQRDVKKVVDLYCGSGLLTTMLADVVEVLGVEINTYAWIDAIENAFINERRVEFLNLDLKEVEEIIEVDTCIVNPPRSGLSSNIIKAIINSSDLRRIFYLSCNPATLARDISSLINSEFKIEKIYLIDFYPQTSHVETLVLLER
ncbi:MAG: 23S rRNA (uracil(1939)-C(5))-methyltransferase RlmD [Actinobacteria bacterium]|nr:23S rRNA (uracil(1939)-C(5))-methyltransferase RlmD [Actinomycetota bacterium]